MTGQTEFCPDIKHVQNTKRREGIEPTALATYQAAVVINKLLQKKIY